MTGGRAEGRIAGLGGVAVVGMLAAWAWLVPDPPGPMAVPTAAELVELEPYLTPVAMDAGQVTVPPTVVVDGDPFGRPAVGSRPSVRRTSTAVTRRPSPNWFRSP